MRRRRNQHFSSGDCLLAHSMMVDAIAQFRSAEEAERDPFGEAWMGRRCVNGLCISLCGESQIVIAVDCQRERESVSLQREVCLFIPMRSHVRFPLSYP